MIRRAWPYLRGRLFFLLRGQRTGGRPRLVGRLLLRCKGSLTIGRRLSVLGQQVPVQVTVGPQGRLTIGDLVFLNQGSNVCCHQEVTIGSGTRLADLVAIYDTDFHQVEPGAPVRTAPVHIGRNVWFGRGAIVLPGVTIGDNAVVAAGAIVTRSVAPNTLVAGAPAKPVRQLAVPPQGWLRT